MERTNEDCTRINAYAAQMDSAWRAYSLTVPELADENCDEGTWKQARAEWMAIHALSDEELLSK
ncbi:MAG: hypothetical protein ACYCYO_01895 [Bacilli bacterium]